ncbi:GNAT family N-acetyltransferase [Kitasatospora sp. LaBMicrA B282]|uniref:GNAT family N-acetyltransferase n=1 Tax=Kitasatospora sp. LaBMicrA B282 TaxID=3420949 RepID=UPI003D098B3B
MLDVQPLDPATAPEPVLAGYHALRAAVVAADRPEDPPLTCQDTIGRLRTPATEDGTCRVWTGHLDGRLAGAVRIALPPVPNHGIVKVEIHVHPGLRRRGFGTELLRAALPVLRDSGRATVFGLPVTPGSAGARWAAQLGFAVTHRTVTQALSVATTSPQLWDVPVPTGYRLAHWTGRTPELFVDSYAVARQAAQDAPHGRASLRATADWTPSRIRAREREAAAAGIEQRVVIAVENATHRVAGVHVVQQDGFRPELALVEETAVSAAHRGRGLRPAMTAAMLRWITDERPELARLLATTAASDTGLLALHQALGYRTTRETDWVETATANLVEQLAVPAGVH